MAKVLQRIFSKSPPRIEGKSPSEEAAAQQQDAAAKKKPGVVPHGCTEDEFNTMSGRMSVDGMPTKTAEEALSHMREISIISGRVNAAMQCEAKRLRADREHVEQATHAWLVDILPDFASKRKEKETLQLWRRGLPDAVRPMVWKAAIGNERDITVAAFNRCIASATPCAAAGSSSASDHRTTTMHFRTPSGLFDNQISVDVPRTVIAPRDTASPRHNTPDLGIEVLVASRLSPAPTPTNVRSPTSDTEPDDAIAPSPAQPSDAAPCRSSEDSEEPPPEVLLTEATLVGGSTPPSAVMQLAANVHIDSCDENSSTSSNKSGRDTLGVEGIGHPPNANIQDELSLLLRAWVELRPDMGYVQGMSYVGAMLLLHMPLCDAFIALGNLLMQDHFPFFYKVNHRGMSAHLALYDAALELAAPELATRLAVAGVKSQMYVIDWWVTLFSRSLSLPLAVRCWDLYLSDPLYLYRITVALVLYLEEELGEKEGTDALLVLTHVADRTIDARLFFALVVPPEPRRGLHLPTRKKSAAETIPSLAALTKLAEKHLAPWRYKTEF
jgi:hypothetical protein